MNHYWQRTARGVRISDAGRAFRREVAVLMMARRPTRYGASPVMVAVSWNMADRRKSDIDNRIKPLLDALQHAGLYDDDSQVKNLVVEFGEITKGGSCDVVVVGL